MTFPEIKFSGTLRPTQQEVVSIVKQQLSDDQREFYIVAPPGSGKTVTGLYLWAHTFKCPTLVLSPNSAIQSQWLARTDLFKDGDSDVDPSLLSSNPKNPSLLTS
ncbi:MAG: DEAD/DEAH box helicase family protein, partial [Pirellulaceae bacterium]